jgi:hypothetical protein
MGARKDVRNAALVKDLMCLIGLGKALPLMVLVVEGVGDGGVITRGVEKDR